MVEQFRIEGESNSAAKDAANKLRAGIYEAPESNRKAGSKVAALDEPKEKPKDKPDDKPKTKEDMEREAAEAGKRLVKESANGEWTDDSKKTWKLVFDGIAKQKDATPERVFKNLNRVGSELNDMLEKAGSDNRIGLAMVEDGKKGEVRYYMQLNGPGISKVLNATDIADDKDSKTVIKAGTLKNK